MEKTRRRLLLVAFILAILGSLSVYMYLESLDTRPEVEEIKLYSTLVAKTDIPPRTTITESMVETIETYDEQDKSLFFTEANQVIGQKSSNQMFKGAPFSKGSFQVLEDLPLNLKITGNMRAVSVGVSGQSGVANLIQPGDRVDVLVYLPEIKENQVVVRADIVKIILQNVEVLGVDSYLNLEDFEEGSSVEADFNSSQMYLATLSVPIQELEKLILAKDIGAIDLALRPLEGDYIYATEGVIWQELLIDDFAKMKDMFPNYEVNSVGKVAIDSDAMAYEEYIYYTVKYGDTLRSISELFYGTQDNYVLLKQVNRIDDENLISAGMGLKVPVISE